MAIPVMLVDQAPTGDTAISPGLAPGVPVTNASGNVANAAAVATLPAAAGKVTYITGFDLTAAGATAGIAVLATVAGVLGGTMTFVFVAPTGVAVGASPLQVRFPFPIPAAAENTPIVVTLPALGLGNTHAAAVAYGFQR